LDDDEDEGPECFLCHVPLEPDPKKRRRLRPGIRAHPVCWVLAADAALGWTGRERR